MFFPGETSFKSKHYVPAAWEYAKIFSLILQSLPTDAFSLSKPHCVSNHPHKSEHRRGHVFINFYVYFPESYHQLSQIAKFMGPTWGPPGSCRPQMGPMLATWTLLSRFFITHAEEKMKWSGRQEVEVPCIPLQWRHNEHDGVWNHQRLDCLLNRLFRRRSKKISKLRVTGLCEGNAPVTGAFPH